MTQAQPEGMIGLDWFLLSDTATPGASQDPYAYMGLYLDIASLTTTQAKATTGETATATYALAASGPVTSYAWDDSTTATTSTVAPTGGRASLNLTTSAPQFFDVP
jgi:hypothetical protein